MADPIWRTFYRLIYDERYTLESFFSYLNKSGTVLLLCVADIVSVVRIGRSKMADNFLLISLDSSVKLKVFSLLDKSDTVAFFLSLVSYLKCKLAYPIWRTFYSFIRLDRFLGFLGHRCRISSANWHIQYGGLFRDLFVLKDLRLKVEQKSYRKVFLGRFYCICNANRLIQYDGLFFYSFALAVL